VSRYLQPTLPPVCLQVSVTICAVVRFTCLDLHIVPGGLPSSTLPTGSGQMDGREVYSIIRRVPMIVFFGVGTQLSSQPVMSRRPNRGAGGQCNLYSLMFVRVNVG